MVSDFKRFVSRKCRNSDEIEKEIKVLRGMGPLCPDIDEKEMKKDIERGLEILLLVLDIRHYFGKQKTEPTVPSLPASSPPSVSIPVPVPSEAEKKSASQKLKHQKSTTRPKEGKKEEKNEIKKWKKGLH
eukprot:TRINITY_DN4511_c0_g1_i2.p1 TRINITY_DN4511_c0_g1~~TRINITY_DN4511_c0_g1_i2.p1  ORF type:complete len:130 (+),score=56.61 TRINITY_DN4511_c0_g1_i2:3-392(+)